MFCPKCHKELISGEDKEFETLSEHVCDPNQESFPLRATWICVNKNCPVSKENVFWDDNGEYYSWGGLIKFDNDLYSAYPSFARKMDIEIYKKGLQKQTYIHPVFMLWILKPMIEYNYKSNEHGDVLKKTWKLKWLKKDCWYKKDSFGHHKYYTFPFVNIYHFLKNKKREIENIKENGETKWRLNQLKSSFEPIKSWDKRWWRHFELSAAKIIYRKWYLKSKEY